MEHVNLEDEKEDSESCLVCFDKASNAVIMDCGHGGF